MTKANIAPPVLQLDGFRLSRISPSDVALLLEIYDTGWNRLIAHLPESENTCSMIIQNVGAQVWGLPMVAWVDDAPGAVLMNGSSDVMNQHTELISLLTSRVDSPLPLAMYLRHLIWNFPLERAYTYCPVLNETSRQLELYKRLGFQIEGTLRKHGQRSSQRHDVAILGILRHEFLEWCHEHEPRLEF